MPISTDGQGLVYPNFTTFPAEFDAGVEVRRLAAVKSTSTELWTYQDGVEHLLDSLDVGRTDRAQRMAKRALQHAQRTFATYHTWPYYTRVCVINTVDPYSTGAIAFDHDGGAYERQVTLTGGTWPSWAGFGVIRIGTVDYRVLQRVSDTVLTLMLNRSPAADLSAQSYTLYRNLYPLPLDFRRHDRVFDQATGRELSLVDSSLLLANTISDRGLTIPQQAALVEDERHLGSLSLMIGAPSSAAQYSFQYERTPRPLVLERYDTGTLTIVADSASITGSGTAWTSNMIGAVLRISPDTDSPTSPVGSLMTGADNPAAYTRTVMNVVDATTLIVDETLGESASGRAYTLSDSIDVHVQSMLDAFLRLAEYEMARLLRRPDNQAMLGQFWAALDVARDSVRHSSAIENVNVGQRSTGYSMIGTVTVR